MNTADMITAESDLPKRKPTVAKILKAVIAIAAIYLGSYVLLSAKGEWTYSQTGNLRWNGGLSVSDVQRWSPKIAHWEPFKDIYGNPTTRGNAAGYFYSPLIRLDRAYVHPDRLLFESKANPATRPA